MALILGHTQAREMQPLTLTYKNSRHGSSKFDNGVTVTRRFAP